MLKAPMHELVPGEGYKDSTQKVKAFKMGKNLDWFLVRFYFVMQLNVCLVSRVFFLRSDSNRSLCYNRSEIWISFNIIG